MTNKDFWLSIDNIIDNGFTTTGLKTLEEYADRFITGKLLYQRFSSFEQHGCTKGGVTHVIATLLAGAEVSPDCLTAQEGSFQRELQRAEAQAQRIESWAKRCGCWFDDVDLQLASTLGEQIAEGGEAHVFDHGSTIIN